MDNVNQIIQNVQLQIVYYVVIIMIKNNVKFVKIILLFIHMEKIHKLKQNVFMKMVEQLVVKFQVMKMKENVYYVEWNFIFQKGNVF